MKERIIITGYSGSLAKATTKLLKNDYEIIGLTSNKKKVNNNNVSVNIIFLLKVIKSIRRTCLKFLELGYQSLYIFL